MFQQHLDAVHCTSSEREKRVNRSSNLVIISQIFFVIMSIKSLFITRRGSTLPTRKHQYVNQCQHIVISFSLNHGMEWLHLTNFLKTWLCPHQFITLFYILKAAFETFCIYCERINSRQHLILTKC